MTSSVVYYVVQLSNGFMVCFSNISFYRGQSPFYTFSVTVFNKEYSATTRHQKPNVIDVSADSPWPGMTYCCLSRGSRTCLV